MRRNPDKHVSLAGSAVLGCVLSLAAACGTAPVDGVSGTAAAYDRVHIGTFNMLRLGHGDGKNYERLAGLVAEAGYDVFAGVEVMTPEGADEVRVALGEATGDDWQTIVSKNPVGDSTYREYYAFFYKPSVVEAVLPSSAFCKSTAAYDRVESACSAVDKGTEDEPAFARDPFVGHFRAAGQDFVLVAVHFFYGGSDSASVARRRHELTSLRGVMEAARSKTPQADVIAVGDFNLALPQEGVGPAAGVGPRMPLEVFTESPKIEGLVEAPTTVGTSSYDHVLYFAANAAEPDAETAGPTVDFDLDSASERATYKNEVSDHLPVGAVFTID
jgi:endonuclease/exonuclease/phosphatase family metal-dependent hydrolase